MRKNFDELVGSSIEPIKRRLIVGCLLASFVVGLASCSSKPHSWTYRYRLTVEMEKAGRSYSGSSVIEVKRSAGYNGIGGRIRGQAVVVNMGASGQLFALLVGKHSGGSDWALTFPHRLFASELGTSDMVNPNALTRLEIMNGEEADLPPDDYPVFVRFGDLNDRSTVQEVDPTKPSDSFNESLKIKRIFVRMTREPVTSDIVRYLPWVDKGRGALVKCSIDYPIGQRLPFGCTIKGSDFIKGRIS